MLARSFIDMWSVLLLPNCRHQACTVLSHKADRAGGPECRRIGTSGFFSLSARTF